MTPEIGCDVSPQRKLDLSTLAPNVETLMPIFTLSGYHLTFGTDTAAMLAMAYTRVATPTGRTSEISKGLSSIFDDIDE